MVKYHGGIDLHKTVAQVCILDARGETLQERRFPLPEPGSGASFEALRRTGRPSRGRGGTAHGPPERPGARGGS